MEQTKIILLLFLLIVFSGCKSELENRERALLKIATETNKLEDYINFVFEYPSSDFVSGCIIKIDSLVRIDSRIRLGTYWAIDSVSKITWFGFENMNYRDYYLKKRNAFTLTITENGIFHNNTIISSDSVQNIIKYYLFNCLDAYDKPECELTNVKFMGDVLSSKMTCVLETDNEFLNLDKNINWKSYFESLNLIKSTYEKIWNERSIDIWNKNFNQLEFDKQIALMDWLRLNIELNFIKRGFTK